MPIGDWHYEHKLREVDTYGTTSTIEQSMSSGNATIGKYKK